MAVTNPLGPVTFGGTEGSATGEPDPQLLGGKGAGLVRMSGAGLPVPPGFVLPTTACAVYERDGWTPAFGEAVRAGIDALERASGRRLGDPHEPLLVSVRSGAAISMPGMMDTVLDVGMTDDVERGLAELSGSERFALDTHRRFLCSYAAVVGGLDDDAVRTVAADHDAPSALRAALADAGCKVPVEPLAQIVAAARAVFASCDSPRAKSYRRREGIDESMGTAATVQQMVFGNRGSDSGTGVAFTRDPSTGAPGLMGDFLVDAQGEDVVAGTHATLPLDDMAAQWPEIHAELVAAAAELEREYADMVDIEFTVEQGRLFLLQSRRGKRSPVAALRVAVDMANDVAFPLTRAEAVERCRAQLDAPPTSTAPLDDKTVASSLLTTGLPASPGCASGVLCLDIDDAIERTERGEQVVLVRRETSPSDIDGMAVASALVTTLGGMVSHAAVVARSWGLPAIVGANELTVGDGCVSGNGRTVRVGEFVTVDGGAGQLLAGEHVGASDDIAELAMLRRWEAELAGAASGARTPESRDTAEVTELDCLRIVALRGRSTPDAVALATGAAADMVESVVAALVEAGHLTEASSRVTVSPSGRALVDADIAAVVAAHGERFAALLDEFHEPNLALKEIVTAWQLRESGDEPVVNDHSDAEYDAAVISRLRDGPHTAVVAIVASAVEMVPRLDGYTARFEHAIEQLEAGDPRYFASPLIDSYHTVWFELHEELIRLAGRNRADEAAAGRA